MIEILEKHITERIGKRPENLDKVLSQFESLNTKRGIHLLTQGDVCKYVYFIVKGCLQVYVLDKNGNESTRSFYFENAWVTDIFGFKNQVPSSEFVKCIEPCELLRIHFEPFQALCREVPQFDALYKEILEASYNNTVYRVNTLTSLDAFERVKWLMETKPLIMTRLSSKLIASYLGISPETLTRLKSKL
ncbi:Crp/Fnr family transcriptional regulator [Cytophagales bacterium LB-30]|uniref:Crp/Fnr family transcriptional regulator n=1 Tax=Shiella aurantiaca TaxID=3058365 RepID=A0ABT8F564_9BACT|nr:Crp/Fnr family transcriptional regulator [Shiella aurantiaca]MDN4165111.1 Crp/Fnr family transcriptional regulator [Shiella aurantiaca]